MLGVAARSARAGARLGARFASSKTHPTVQVAKSSTPKQSEMEHYASEWPTELGARQFTMRRFGIVEPPHGEEKTFSGEEPAKEEETVFNGFIFKSIAVAAGLFALFELDKIVYPVRYDHPLNKLYREHIASNPPEKFYEIVGQEYEKHRRLSDDHLILQDHRELFGKLRAYNKHFLVSNPSGSTPESHVDMTEVEKKIDSMKNPEVEFLTDVRSTAQLIELPKRHFS